MSEPRESVIANALLRSAFSIATDVPAAPFRATVLRRISIFSRDFRFDFPLPTRRVDRTAFLCKVLAGFGPRCFQRRREGPVSRLVGA
jgi:hypothetical protein